MDSVSRHGRTSSPPFEAAIWVIGGGDLPPFYPCSYTPPTYPSPPARPTQSCWGAHPEGSERPREVARPLLQRASLVPPLHRGGLPNITAYRRSIPGHAPLARLAICMFKLSLPSRPRHKTLPCLPTSPPPILLPFWATKLSIQPCGFSEITARPLRWNRFYRRYPGERRLPKPAVPSSHSCFPNPRFHSRAPFPVHTGAEGPGPRLR